MTDEDIPPLGLDDLAEADGPQSDETWRTQPPNVPTEEELAEGMGPGEPDEVTGDPENVAAADAIRKSTLEEE